MPKIYDELSKEQLQAIEQFMARTVFPIIHDTEKGTEIRGTGCFYKWNEDTFIVTAAHILENVDFDDFGIPAKPLKNSRLRSFGTFDIYKPEIEDLDIAILKLSPGPFLEEVVPEWTVLDVGYNFRGKLFNDSEFLIAGFPAENIEAQDNKLIPKSLFQFYTYFYTGDVEGERGIHDLYMHHKKTVRNSEEVLVQMVALEGASGSPIWKIEPTTENIWAPSANLKLVGVQHGYKPNSYIKGKSWNIVSEMLRKLDSGDH